MVRPALGWIDEELVSLDASGLSRSLEPLSSPQGPVVSVGGRSLVNLCSNDYLGLAADERLKEAAKKAAEREGVGSGASRLVCGDLPVHGELEEKIAGFLRTEGALLFNSGYHANVGVPPTLVGRGDAVFSDELNHASIVDGLRLSRAEIVRYRHADVADLKECLERTKAEKKLVVTDAIFSMDGDAAPLVEIAAACEENGAMLYVDEAHATGVLGPTGGGLAEALGVADRVDVHMGTLGKALGAFGAFIAGEERLVRWLRNRARSFVFTTALPPSVCGAALAALEVVRTEPERRSRLRSLSARMKIGLESLGFALPNVAAPIFPIVLGGETRALKAATELRERGYLVRAIRPPTVPTGTSRLRVTLGATHDEAQVDGFLGALFEVLSVL